MYHVGFFTVALSALTATTIKVNVGGDDKQMSVGCHVQMHDLRDIDVGGEHPIPFSKLNGQKGKVVKKVDPDIGALLSPVFFVDDDIWHVELDQTNLREFYDSSDTSEFRGRHVAAPIHFDNLTIVDSVPN